MPVQRQTVPDHSLTQTQEAPRLILFFLTWQRRLKVRWPKFKVKDSECLLSLLWQVFAYS